MRRFDGRLRRLEAARPGPCEGLYRLEIVRVRRGCEDKLPPPDDHCLLCGTRHPPAPGADGRLPIRRVILSIPDACEDAPIPECGWRPEIMRGEGG